MMRRGGSFPSRGITQTDAPVTPGMEIPARNRPSGDQASRPLPRTGSLGRVHRAHRRGPAARATCGPARSRSQARRRCRRDCLVTGDQCGAVAAVGVGNRTWCRAVGRDAEQGRGCTVRRGIHDCSRPSGEPGDGAQGIHREHPAGRPAVGGNRPRSLARRPRLDTNAMVEPSGDHAGRSSNAGPRAVGLPLSGPSHRGATSRSCAPLRAWS